MYNYFLIKSKIYLISIRQRKIRIIQQQLKKNDIEQTEVKKIKQKFAKRLITKKTLITKKIQIDKKNRRGSIGGKKTGKTKKNRKSKKNRKNSINSKKIKETKRMEDKLLAVGRSKGVERIMELVLAIKNLKKGKKQESQQKWQFCCHFSLIVNKFLLWLLLTSNIVFFSLIANFFLKNSLYHYFLLENYIYT